MSKKNFTVVLIAFIVIALVGSVLVSIIGEVRLVNRIKENPVDMFHWNRLQHAGKALRPLRSKTLESFGLKEVEPTWQWRDENGINVFWPCVIDDNCIVVGRWENEEGRWIETWTRLESGEIQVQRLENSW